jgi:uncharacterized repeat protein (TIGR01451 family)/CSLREA domain-containing protein
LLYILEDQSIMNQNLYDKTRLRQALPGLALIIVVGMMLTIISYLSGGSRMIWAAPAATIIVNSTADSAIAGDGSCTLREAITNANDNNDSSSGDCATGSGADTIEFDPSVNGGTITLTSALPEISDDLTINGPGAANLTISGNNSVRHFTISGDSTVEISNVTLTNGHESSFGGSIYTFGTLSLDSVIVSNNTTSGIYQDGAIFNYGGTLIIKRSSIVHNHGGSAIVNDDSYINTSSQTTLINSTVSGNRSSSAIFNYIGGGTGESIVHIINSTITDNSTDGAGGAIYNGCSEFNMDDCQARVYMTNSIIAGNKIGSNTTESNADCYSNGGTITSQGHNLVGAGTGCPSDGSNDQSVAPASLFTTVLEQTLADNGGDTLTHALLGGSPATDAADNTLCADASTVNNVDQRGVTRPIDGNNDGTATCDIGAFEHNTITLGDRVWQDFDGDGIQDEREPGAAGVSVNLLIDDTTFFSTTTDASGNYLFTVPPNTYRVQFTGFDTNIYSGITQQGAGSDSSQDSDPSPVSGITEPIPMLMVGKNNDSVDAGLIPKQNPSVQGTVFIDKNGDGNYEAESESGLPNISIVITDSRHFTYTLSTDASGFYSQTVPAGKSIVDVDENDPDMPAELILSPGADDPTTVNVPIGGRGIDNTGYITPTDITISKSVMPSSALPGDLITYTLAYSNVGASRAIGVVISDTIPSEVISTSVSSSGAILTPRSGLSWDVADLAPNQGGLITITGQLSWQTAYPFTNTAIITSPIDINASNNSSHAAVTLVSSVDYSDLPRSYGSAWHTGNGTLWLGSSWDSDSNAGYGQDDDNDNGIEFPAVISTTNTVTVTVSGTSSEKAWLAVWFDWDQSGTFDENEQAYNASVITGTVLISMTQPAPQGSPPILGGKGDMSKWPFTTQRLAYRLRLYDSASQPVLLAPTGPGNGGEVEDGITDLFSKGNQVIYLPLLLRNED